MRLWPTGRWTDKEMSLWWNISNIWYNLTLPVRVLYAWIIKSFQYAWFLRNDYDFDYSSILILLQYKLSRTRKCITKNQIIVRADEIGAQIKHAEDLIEKWRTNDFCRDLYDAHDKKWGKIVDKFEPIEYKGIKMYKWNMTRENATTEELQSQERKESLDIHQKAREAEEKCLDDLFAHMRKYLQEWWD